MVVAKQVLSFTVQGECKMMLSDFSEGVAIVGAILVGLSLEKTIAGLVLGLLGLILLSAAAFDGGYQIGRYQSDR